MQTPYPVTIEQQMQRYYTSLSEKDRRRYAAIEAVKLGHGGISYIGRVLNCDYRTIQTGMRELNDETALNDVRIRQPGGGRKAAFETIEDLDEAFLRIIADHTAGSPMDDSVKWTHLTRSEIAQLLQRQENITVSVTVIDQLLAKHHYRRRQAQKTRATGSHPQRNEQFENIQRWRQQYQTVGNPVLSMDTKKELIGPFYRPGHTYNTEAIEVFDHDWTSLADGVAIPHGLYDLALNQGFLQIGTSRDTSEFACDSVHHWWTHHGQQQYPHATALLLLCDCGGSNSARYYIFKQDRQALATALGLEIRIAHYPPYTSKYNPIAHRLFPHVSRAGRGVIFDTLETVRDIMAKAVTKTGLTVFTTILDQVYQTGRTATYEFKQKMPIRFDEYLPQWNYVARPQLT